MQKLWNSPKLWLYGLLSASIAAVMLKLSLLLVGVIPFNSDEAIVALMARHILAGELPIFFYGQAYMGSLDAFLVAGLFKLVGNGVWSIRWVQIGLYSLTILTTAYICRRITGSWKVGVIAAWFLAIPNVNMTLYSTISLGGYGEMLLIGNLILLTTHRITWEIDHGNEKKVLWPWFALGFLSGTGLWAFGLSLVYSITAVIYLAWYLYRTRRMVQDSENAYPFADKLRNIFNSQNIDRPVIRSGFVGILLVGLIFGSAPWWAYAQQTGFSTLFHELGGGAIAGVEGLNPLQQVFQHILNLSLFGTTVTLGLRPPWEIRWLAMPLAPLVIIFWIVVVAYAVRKSIAELKIGPQGEAFSHAPLLMGILLILVVGFVLTPFGADPSGRYFLPAGVILTIFAAQAIKTWSLRLRKYAWVVVVLILSAHLWGTFQVARLFPPGLTTQFDRVTQIDHTYDQELIQFLRSKGEIRGFTNYWVAYPLAYLSDEEIIFVPKLPYHQDLRYTPRDNRYSEYNLMVNQAEKVAYITTNNPPLDMQIRSGFKKQNVSWRETQIGDYHIYYQLSKRTPPELLGLEGAEG
jgi:hypothetical protein